MTPKDTIFLHIGMAKTATSSIQHSLKTYTDGITRYAHLARPNHSRQIISVFGAPEITKKFLLRSGFASTQEALQVHRADNLALLEAEINSPERNLILSGEGLAALNDAGVADLRDFLSTRCTQVRLIAYVRDPVSFTSSAFQEHVKSSKRIVFSAPTPKYQHRFGSFVKAFGADAIDFVRFDPETFPDHCIITDFCARTGIDASQVIKKRSNESLSNEAVALLLFWNRQGVESFGSEDHLAARKKLTTLLRRRFPGKFKFDPAFVQAGLDIEDCRWMEHLAGFSLLPSPTDPAKAATGISSEAQLKDLCLPAMPGLREILAERGLSVGGRIATGLMDRLYRSLLGAAQTG